MELEQLIKDLNKAGIITKYCCEGHYKKDGYHSAYITFDLKAMNNAELHIDNDSTATIYWDRGEENGEENGVH